MAFYYDKSIWESIHISPAIVNKRFNYNYIEKINIIKKKGNK